jgi:hypothetical protein
MPVKPENPRWLDDAVQFPRLIAELESTGAFTPAVLQALSEEMDLTEADICELIDRAQAAWDDIKQRTKPGAV